MGDHCGDMVVSAHGEPRSRLNRQTQPVNVTRSTFQMAVELAVARAVVLVVIHLNDSAQGGLSLTCIES